MEDKEILALIAKKYPDGFPEEDNIFGDLKGLTEEQVIGIFRLGYEIGKEEAEGVAESLSESHEPPDYNDLD